MNWEQDAGLIIPAVNKVIGKEVRAISYMHWWTFAGAYMEIGESLFSQVLSIRQKKQKHQKLEKWEQEFYQKNRSMIDLKKRYSEEEKQKQRRAKNREKVARCMERKKLKDAQEKEDAAHENDSAV